MKFQLIAPGPFVMLKVQLDYGESLKAESGAMIAMSDTVDVQGKAEGGILKGIARMFAGESFFFQTLVASRGPGEVLLAHAIPGEIHPIQLDGKQDYILQKDGFFAATADVDISTKVQNLWKGMFSGEGFFVLRASGVGTLFVSSYGAIHPLDLADGQEVIVDNGHLVAWPANMNYSIEKASSGWISSFTSGEGLVCRFRGPGRILIQTRNPTGFAAWLTQFLPKK
ncbi:MAG: TIGR00266 family protein [Gemmatales bacterium]|nr:TIGR00266 family protein [Gemmatales bacterium]MDW7993308.1 TIGR00266 family protein [Gemmatales bacterium]